MKITKTIVLAALFAAVQGIQLNQKNEPGTHPYHPALVQKDAAPAEIAAIAAEAAHIANVTKPANASAAAAVAEAPPAQPVAPKAGQSVEEAAAEATAKLTEKDEERLTKQVVAQEKTAALVEAKKTEVAAAKEEAVVEARQDEKLKKEDAAITAKKAGEKSVEVQKEELDIKIEEINLKAHTEAKARGRVELAAKIKTDEDDTRRKRSIVESFKAQLKITEAETAKEVAAKKAEGAAAAAASRELTDEEWVANMPSHHLKGYEHLPHHPSFVQLDESI